MRGFEHSAWNTGQVEEETPDIGAKVSDVASYSPRRGAGKRRTHAEAVDNATHKHLRKMPRDDLEHGADEVANQAYSNRLLPAQPVAEGEGEDCSEEGTELFTVLESVQFAVPVSLDWRHVLRRSSR